MQPDVVEFFDPATYTYSYVVIDPASQHCAIIDSVLDYDAASGRTSHASAERIVAFVRARDLHVEWLLETHVHADHLSAAPFLKRELGGQLAIGENIRVVQNTFGKLFNAGSEFATDGSQFDRLLQMNISPEVEANIQQYVSAIERRRKRLSQSVTLTLGSQIDSNRNSAPNDKIQLLTGTPTAITSSADKPNNDIAYIGALRYDVSYDLGYQEGHEIFASVTGYGSDQGLLRLKKRSTRDKPDIAFLSYATTDLLRHVNVYRTFLHHGGDFPFLKPRYAINGIQPKLIRPPLL